MPTIEQLEPVVVASDDDKIPVSQGGIVRRVSRAQFLAGMQSALSLSTGLLGRTSKGFGPPEPIGIGGSLTLTNGVLSSPPQFTVSALPQNSNVGSNDLVAISKAGRDAAVPVSALLSAAGADVSGQVVKASLANVRKLSDWVSDALEVEAFGAIGDGVADDTAAFARALASGQPVRLGPKTYRVDGQWTITVPATLLGIPGVSAIRRTRQSGGAWISVVGPSFVAIGITFDAGVLADESWAVQVNSACTATLFETCTFANARGPRLGNGLTIQARDGVNGAPSSHTIRNCSFQNNAVHGLWIQAAAGASVEGCCAFQNGSYGICLDFNDPNFGQLVRHCTVIACRSWANQRGISVGNFNESNLEPPRWGPGNPDARDILIADNVCFDNSAYGIAAAGQGIQVHNNIVSTSAGFTTASAFLFNATQSALRCNSAFGPGQFGIDAGGCISSEIIDNLVDGFQVGINAGGGTDMRVDRNRLRNNNRAITAFQVETDGSGSNFGIACTDLQISTNRVELRAGGDAGILLFDGPQNVQVYGNQFICVDGEAAGSAISVHTDIATVLGNLWNGSTLQNCDTVQVGAATYLLVPEICDAAAIPATATEISGVIGRHQLDVSGQITFIRATQGGSGYLNASVTISGSGTGAEAIAYVRDGAVIGIALLAGGSGYDAVGTQVTLVGDGVGAAALAFVGLPVLDGRRLTLTCNATVGLTNEGTVGSFENWTNGALTIPAQSEVVCVGFGGRWRAVSFVATNFLSPDANGNVSFRSNGGDVTLQPRGGGLVRISSETEMAGFVTCLGRGSPEGVVSASPGSDYRNLDGGAGQTLWLKRAGAGNTGWSAIG